MTSADAVPTDKPFAIDFLSRALHRIRSTPPRIIASPPTQPRRAAVALIIRVVPAPTGPTPLALPSPPTLTQFFDQDWVRDSNAVPEILFLRRHPQAPAGSPAAAPDRDPSLLNSRLRNTREAHVAFPGGRTEDGDEGGLYTAMRQTWEEVGIDLAEREYAAVGQLDDREITTSLGKRLLMILSPFVFLQLYPTVTPPDPAPGTDLHWVPLSALASPYSAPRWGTVTVDASSRLAPRHSNPLLRLLVRTLVGSMQFPAILIPSAPPLPPPSLKDPEKGRPYSRQQLKLWGLSLGMTLDLMAHMVPVGSSVSRGNSALTRALQMPFSPVGEPVNIEVVAPSLASVFPRFSYPDVNFWIWVFGKRYRDVIRSWEASVRTGGVVGSRVNWSGSALNTFYAAVRKALVVVIVLRAIGVLLGLAITGWWVFWR